MLILEGHTSPVYALAFSPDSYLLASGAKDGVAALHSPAGEMGALSQTSPSPMQVVAFSPDGLRLGLGRLRGWEWHRRLYTEVWDRVIGYGGEGYCPALAFVSDNLVAIGRGDRSRPVPGDLELWDFERREPRPPKFTEPHGVRSVATHPPSKSVAWTNGSRRASVWNIVKPDPIHFNLTHVSPAVAFHPDGTMIAVAQEWGARVLDIPRRQERTAVKGHKGQVTSLAFSPDGRTLATGSWDGTVRLWDPLSGAERQSFQWPTGRVYALAYAPDGTRLAAAGEKGTIVVWDTE